MTNLFCNYRVFKTFQVIQDHINSTGQAPTCQVIAESLTIPIGTVKHYIRTLKREGVISSDRYSASTIILNAMKPPLAVNLRRCKQIVMSRADFRILQLIRTFHLQNHRPPSFVELAAIIRNSQHPIVDTTLKQHLSHIKACGYIDYRNFSCNLTLTSKPIAESIIHPKAITHSPIYGVGITSIAETISRYIEDRLSLGEELYGASDISINTGLCIYTAKYTLKWLVQTGYISRTKGRHPIDIIKPFRADEYIRDNYQEPNVPERYINNSSGLPRYSIHKIQRIYDYLVAYIDEHGNSPSPPEIAAEACMPLPTIHPCLKWLVDNRYITRVYKKPRTYSILRPFNSEEWLQQFRHNKRNQKKH